jgi:hypothetical protein
MNCKGFVMKRSRYNLVVYTFSKILGATLKFPGARRVTWRKLQTGDPQMLGATHHKRSHLVVLASVICVLLVWLICLSPRICQEALCQCSPCPGRLWKYAVPEYASEALLLRAIFVGALAYPDTIFEVHTTYEAAECVKSSNQCGFTVFRHC